MVFFRFFLSHFPDLGPFFLILFIYIKNCTVTNIFFWGRPCATAPVMLGTMDFLDEGAQLWTF
jgi:hypothetical protein